MKKQNKKIRGMTIFIIILMIFGVLLLIAVKFDIFKPQENIDKGIWGNLKGDLLDMSNTISPVINAVCDKLCPFSSRNESSWGLLSGQLIYKIEPSETCIYGEANVYYCRCYRWDWQDEYFKLEGLNDNRHGLYFKVIEDKSLEEFFGEKIYSCINENELIIPYYDKELAEMQI